MECIKPLKAIYARDGDITFSKNTDQHMPGSIPFAFPCRKCLPCRLNIAREKAIRAFHEAKMHKENIFLTLTYAEEHLHSPRLNYQHFQKFMQDLRDYTRQHHNGPKISYMVTGEYGDKNKRPHWHAIIFNYAPIDAQKYYTTDLGEQVFQSPLLTKIWGKGKTEFGSVTLESAGYVARYAAKKLTHGKDQEHDFHPIHKTSSKYGIGRTWIELHWKHTFENGFVYLPNGQKAKIPRYYQDWLKKHKPEIYSRYVTQVKQEISKQAEEKKRKEELDFYSTVMSRNYGELIPLTRPKVKETILQSKFKTLQERLKL